MKLGISSYALAWSVGVPGYEPPVDPLTALDLLDIASHHQVGVVQIADNIPLHVMPEDELRRLKASADALGIELEIGTRGTDPAHLLSYLRIAKTVGASLCRTLITDKDLSLPTHQLRKVLPVFQAAGVSIAVENHGLHTTDQLAELFDELDHPYLGCCLDTVNSFGALESPAKVIRDLLPYAINLHVKDFEISRVDHQMGFTVLGKPAGYGKLDISGLLRAVRAGGRHPNAILELWTPYSHSVGRTVALERSWFEQSLQYLKTYDFAE